MFCIVEVGSHYLLIELSKHHETSYYCKETSELQLLLHSFLHALMFFQIKSSSLYTPVQPCITPSIFSSFIYSIYYQFGEKSYKVSYKINSNTNMYCNNKDIRTTQTFFKYLDASTGIKKFNYLRKEQEMRLWSQRMGDNTTIQVTSSLVVTSDKINACSVYAQKAYLRAARVSVAPRPRDQLNAKDADVTSLPN